MTTEIKFEAYLVREPLKAKSDDWQETAHKWRCLINGVEFDYYTGLAHREPKPFRRYAEEYNRLKNKNLTDYGWNLLLEASKATPPKLDDLLYSLVMDASAQEQSFEDWCSDFGYETDSRKALETYLACQSAAVKLRKAGVNIEAERERLKDY